MGDLRNKVIDFVKLQRTDFDFEEGNSTETHLAYANRENGDGVEEEFSEIDWEAGVVLAKTLKGEFGTDITVSLEPVDEWVILDINLVVSK